MRQLEILTLNQFDIEELWNRGQILKIVPRYTRQDLFKKQWVYGKQVGIEETRLALSRS